MSSIDYLNALAARGIELWTDGGKLQYKAPKEAITPELLAELKANKATLVELLEQFAGTAGSYPLSYSQKSLWSLHRLQPESAAYNVIYAAAPLIGLTGTVVGLLKVFSQISPDTGLPDPVAFTQGVALALSATVIGLCIAIPSLVGSGYLQRKIENYSAQLDVLLERILQRTR